LPEIARRDARVEQDADSAARAWIEQMRLRHPIHFVVAPRPDDSGR